MEVYYNRSSYYISNELAVTVLEKETQEVCCQFGLLSIIQIHSEEFSIYSMFFFSGSASGF